jgi:hypothetical protein
MKSLSRLLSRVALTAGSGGSRMLAQNPARKIAFDVAAVKLDGPDEGLFSSSSWTPRTRHRQKTSDFYATPRRAK